MSSDMPEAIADIPALIGSRICHDLISPIGAIGNGVELLSMSGGGLGPELSLIAESVNNANARIRFYRIAFGHAGREQRMSRAEIVSILSDLYAGSRLTVSWNLPADCSRREAKAALLALLCLETAMPYGGRVSVDQFERTLKLTGSASKLRIDDHLWQGLETRAARATDLTPALVHFALLPELLEQAGRNLTVKRSEEGIVLSF